ncbi:MAG: PAAR domain-containing protein [Paludisphaera borealis]|uniref:PAAR domain-containing protein n=1 Tax=Paludisphaera borealis TaxID=1387353 RepID=UPI002851FEB1|nr:PAAR domain-containing protein [Paludisphaera borealis]MDR3618420.1 PAAR domain-containing protein [Paludisphaera borealis]
MPQGPAARVGDPVAHPLPPVLGPGPGSVNVLIGNQPAWRGMPLAAAAGLMAAKAASDLTVATAVTASTAAAGTPGAPAAVAAETAAKQAATSSMTAAMSGAGAGADKHMCATPFPPTVPLPHSQGMVITGSMTVMINNLPACRAGDTILECMGPPNSIAMGLPTVLIGDSMYMGQGGALAMAAKTGTPFCEVCSK